jgi:hypothetical protein
VSDENLTAILPRGCGADEVIPLLPRPRVAFDASSLGASAVGIEWDGSDADREKARTEIGSALADIGFNGSDVKFVDELSP